MYNICFFKIHNTITKHKVQATVTVHCRFPIWLCNDTTYITNYPNYAKGCNKGTKQELHSHPTIVSAIPFYFLYAISKTFIFKRACKAYVDKKRHCKATTTEIMRSKKLTFSHDRWFTNEGSNKSANLIFKVDTKERIYQYITMSQKQETWPGKLFPALFYVHM